MIFNRKHFSILLIFAVFFSILSPLGTQLASAYTTRDTSITTQEACNAAGGKFNTAYNGSTLQSYCDVRSSPSDESRIILYAGWLASCIQDEVKNDPVFDIDQLNESQIDAGGSPVVGHWIDHEDGRQQCAKPNNVKAALKTLGYSSLIPLLYDIGCKDSGSTISCVNTNATSLSDSDLYKKFATHQHSDIVLENYSKYFIALNTFKIGCKATEIINPSDADTFSLNNDSGTNIYKIKVLNDDGKDTHDALYKAGLGRGAEISTINTSAGWEDGTFQCQTLASMINKYSGDYLSFALLNPAQRDTDTSALGNTSEPDDTPAKSSCTVEGVGWIVCPVTKFMAVISDGAFNIIKSMLTVNTKLVDTESGTYAAWAAFRNIANVAFVIAFLIIIFSQLTGAGVSNYGIKKTLPRLIVTVILVNVSFYICQLAVDITQILGASIADFLKSIGAAKTPSVPSSFTDVMGDVLSGTGIVLGIVAVGAATVAAIALSVSTPVLLAVLLSVLMTVIILIARQAAIVILIAIAPLAFVAYLLPNTESWFKKWYKMFIALLMLYPIIALLYGGGALASNILTNVASNSEGTGKFLFAIMAIGVAAIPLIMTPFLLKGAMNSTGAIGAKLSGFASKANKGVGRATANSKLGEARQGLKNRFALQRAERRGNSKNQRRFDNSPIGKSLGLDKGAARALRAVDKEQDEEVEARISQIQHSTTSTDRVQKSAEMLKKAIAEGDITTARAAQKVLLGSGNIGISTLQGVYSDKAIAQTMKDDKTGLTGFLRSEINSAGLKGKNNAVARWGYEGGADALANGYKREKKDKDGKVILKADGTPEMEDIKPFAEDASTVVKLNAVELAGQSAANLRKAESAVTYGAAAAVLGNSAAASLLDDEKRKFFQSIVDAGNPDAPAGPARVAATKRIEEAAAGTAGTTPIIMGSTREATQAAPDQPFTVPRNSPTTPERTPSTPASPTTQAAPLPPVPPSGSTQNPPAPGNNPPGPTS